MNIFFKPPIITTSTKVQEEFMNLRILLSSSLFVLGITASILFVSNEKVVAENNGSTIILIEIENYPPPEQMYLCKMILYPLDQAGHIYGTGALIATKPVQDPENCTL